MQLDDLPIEGAVFQVGDYGPHPKFDTDIYVDEWVAHVLEELIEELVTELPRGAGVAAAVHEDREVILVASGGVPRDRLEAWLNDWFAAKLADLEPLEGD